MPSAIEELYFAVLIPMTSPLLFTSAPPLLPLLIAALVCKTVRELPSTLMVCSFMLTMPSVAESPMPMALPIAMTHSPTSRSSESPKVAVVTFSTPAFFKSDQETESTARSDSLFVPTTFAGTLLSPSSVT